MRILIITDSYPPEVRSSSRLMKEMADVFVLPSCSENFGMAVAKAMQAGLPVVTTREVRHGRIFKKSRLWFL